MRQIFLSFCAIFCSLYFRPFFALLPHYWPRKLKFRKNGKKTWIYYPFTHVYHKSISYDVWFLRYEVPQTEFFCHKCTKNLIIGYTVPEIWRVTDVVIFILGYTSPIYSCPLELSSFDTSVPKIMIICYTVPEIWHVTDVIFFHFGQFFALFAPLTVQKIKI